MKHVIQLIIFLHNREEWHFVPRMKVPTHPRNGMWNRRREKEVFVPRDDPRTRMECVFDITKSSEIVGDPASTSFKTTNHAPPRSSVILIYFHDRSKRDHAIPWIISPRSSDSHPLRDAEWILDREQRRGGGQRVERSRSTDSRYPLVGIPL